MARKGHNHFMIPCTGDWSEPTFEHEGQCFRRYGTAWEGYRGHSEYLEAEFPKLRNSHYKGWAKGLEKSGYNGDSEFAERIIDIVKQYELDDFDGQ
jgi:flagellum-specific peptidoglycan hydrolase FlgJ